MSKAIVISDGVRMHVGRRLWAMIELQGLTGIRPGEVVILRGCDLSTQEKTWEYVPAWHKTEQKQSGRMTQTRISRGCQQSALDCTKPDRFHAW
jgi:integrase